MPKFPLARRIIKCLILFFVFHMGLSSFWFYALPVFFWIPLHYCFFPDSGQDKIIYSCPTLTMSSKHGWFNGLHHLSCCGCSLDQHQKKTVADHLQQPCFLVPQVATDCLNHQLDPLSSHQATSFQLGLLLHLPFQQTEGSKPQGSSL